MNFNKHPQYSKESYFCVNPDAMHLIFEITPNRVAAYEQNGEQLSELANELFPKQTEEGMKESLKQVLVKIGNIDRFDHYSCSYFGKEFCLVPNALFASSSPEALLQFTIQRAVSKADVEYNRLSEWGVVIVYELPMWIKTTLIPKAPRIVINHEITHVLRHLTVGSLVPLRSHLILHDEEFSLVIRKDGNIVHTSIQEYQNEEDIVYHLATCFTQLGIASKNELFIHGMGNVLDAKKQKLVELLKKINHFSETRFEIQTGNHLLFQKLCV